MCLWRKQYSNSLKRPSRTTGSMKRTNFISVDRTLSTFSEQQLLKDRLFILNGQMNKQTVSLCYLLGPLLANAAVCSIEERLEQEGKMPTYYRQFVDDTLTVMPNKKSAENLLETLSQCHSSVMFTMEIESNGMVPFLGTQLLNRSSHVETKVCVKLTNTGLLLHYRSHVDVPYKRALLRPMFDRAFRL